MGFLAELKERTVNFLGFTSTSAGPSTNSLPVPYFILPSKTDVFFYSATLGFGTAAGALAAYGCYKLIDYSVKEMRRKDPGR